MSPALAAVIERFAVGGRVLTMAVEGLTPEQARTKVAPGDWSIAEVVGHLVDSDLVLADRMKRIIAEENPTLLVADETAWVQRLRSDEMPMDEGVSIFDLNRRRMTRLLKGCSEADFARSGTHSVKGKQTLAEVLVLAAHHLDHHLMFLYTKRSNLGVAVQPRYSRDQNQ